MAYKKETIKKVMTMANEYMEYFKGIPASELQTVISDGNSKIGHVLNVSHMPGMGCPNCKACLPYCYDLKACARFPKNVLRARVLNEYLIRYDREKYFADIRAALDAWKGEPNMRWHQAGEIPDMEYLQGMVTIAVDYPGFTFWTYTKMYNLVNEYRATFGDFPRNLCIMFSPWDGVEVPNPYNMPEFHVRLKNGNRDHTREWFEQFYRCPGNCQICLKAKRGCPFGETVYTDEH